MIKLTGFAALGFQGTSWQTFADISPHSLRKASKMALPRGQQAQWSPE